MKSKRINEPSLTARPRTAFDEIREAPSNEPGLSVDADELGSHFLSEATETSVRRRPDQLSLGEAAPSDAALVGPNFDTDHSIWESTVDLTLQEGDANRFSDVEEASEDEEEDTRPTLDLTQDSIREASLLDEEGAESGEVESPMVITDDNRHPKDEEERAHPTRK